MRAGTWRTGIIAAAIMCTSGCVSLVHQITQPRTPHSKVARASAFIESEYFDFSPRTMTARGGNRIAYVLLPAADYKLEQSFWRDSRTRRFGMRAQWGTPTPVPASGTIVYLHGWADDHRTMLLWATALAPHGYRGVLPDLRNFGKSDRAPVGFGPREAGDIVDLLKSLQAHGELQRPVYLFGESYGATVAINTAAQAPELVDGVVALEPFVDAASAIRGFIEESKSPSSSINGKAFAFYARHAFTRARTDRAILESGQRLGIDLDKTGIRAPLRDNHVCTLLVQGGRDEFLDASNVRALRDSPRVRYVELPNESHLSLPVRIDLLADPVAAWLQDSTDCPAFAAPDDPFEVARPAPG